MEFEDQCDEAFLEEIKHNWEIHGSIKNFGKVLAIALWSLKI